MNQPGEADYQIKFPPPSDDGLRLPDLQEWIKFYGGYHNIPPAAWERWERPCGAYREYRQVNSGSPIIRK